MVIWIVADRIRYKLLLVPNQLQSESMKAAKDIIIVVVVISLMVSSTAAWYYGGLTYEGTNPYAINFVDTGFVVTQSDWVYSGKSKVILTLSLENNSTVIESADIEIQPLDSDGNILLDGGVNMTQYASTGNIAPGDIWTQEFTFQKSGIRLELNVFQILITGEDSFVPGDKLSTYNIEQTIYTSGGGTTLAVKTLAAYMSGTIDRQKYPKYRFNDGNWSAEIELINPVQEKIREVRIEFNPHPSYNDRALMIIVDDDGYLYSYDYNGFSWSTPVILGRVWISAPSEPARPFDIAFERSGHAVLLYSNVLNNDGSKDLAYRIWNGVSWGSEQYLDDPKSSTANTKYMWVQLAPSQGDGSDNIGFVGIDNNNLEYASAVWDGSSWGSWNRITTSPPALWRESAAIAWEYTSGECVLTYSTGTQVGYQTWSGSWSSPSTLSLASDGDDWVWLRLKPHLSFGSDRLMLLGLDDGDGVSAVDWTGSGWNGVGTILDRRMETSNRRSVDGDWEPLGTKFLVAGGNRNINDLSYKTWTPAGGWSHSTNNWATYTSALGNDQCWMQVTANPRGDSPYMTIAWMDIKDDVVLAEYDGTSMVNSLELTKKSRQEFESFDIANSWR